MTNNHYAVPTEPISSATPTKIETTYRSTFDAIKALPELHQVAEIFASSDFVPKAFQGKEHISNCMIALYMAGQLNLNPLTLMQQLYIIDGRPSLSAALANALFNSAQGKNYTQIQIERGIDGTVTYDVMKKSKDQRGYTIYVPTGEKRTIPNHWAVAYTQNRKTGERYESSRVSVQTALDNSWLTKYQSKWQTLPELMCTYRSEAFLIRSHFPEVLFGLYFTDELEDIKASENEQATVEVVTRPTPALANPAPQLSVNNPDVADKLAEEMNAATTIDELKNVGVKVKSATLSPQAKERLRAVYHARNQALANVTSAVVEQVVEERMTTEEEKPQRRQSRTPKAQEPQFDENATITRIVGATTENELSAINREIHVAEKAGTISPETAEKLAQIVENRYVDLSEAEENQGAAQNPQASSPTTTEMDANLFDLIREVKSQSSADGLKKVVDKANEWRTRGDISDEQFDKVVDVAQARRGEIGR